MTEQTTKQKDFIGTLEEEFKMFDKLSHLHTEELLAQARQSSQMAPLAVAFMLQAGNIKKLIEFAKLNDSGEVKNAAMETEKALFSPVEIVNEEPTPEAEELAKGYMELIENG